jgi:hypothetical protein
MYSLQAFAQRAEYVFSSAGATLRAVARVSLSAVMLYRARMHLRNCLENELVQRLSAVHLRTQVD